MAKIIEEVEIIFKNNGKEAKQDVDSYASAIDKTTSSTQNSVQATNSYSSALKSNGNAVLENGGAMGILNDLTGGYAMIVKDAVEASALFTKAKKVDTAVTEGLTVATEAQTVATAASTLGLKALRIALAATGIGLIVVAVGVLAANWDRVTASFKESLPSMDKVGSIMNKLTEIIVGVGTAVFKYLIAPFKIFSKLIQGDFKGAVAEAKNGLNLIGNYAKGAADERLAQQKIANKKELEELIETNKKKIEVMKAGGKETYALELQNSKNKQKLYKDDKDKLAEAQQEEKVLIAGHQKAINDAQAKANEKAANDAIAAEKERNKKILDARKEYLDKTKLDTDSVDGLEVNIDDVVNKIKTDGEKTNEANKEIMLEDLANKAAIADLEVEVANNKQKELEENKRKETENAVNALNEIASAFDETNNANAAFVEASVQLDKIMADGKAELAESVSAGLAVASEALGKQTAAGKAAAIAETTINTYKSAQSAYASLSGIPIVGPALGAVAAGIAVAAGLANVKKILSVKTPGGAGSGSAPSASAVPASAAPTTTFISSRDNQLASSISGSINNKPTVVKAIVVSKDVTTAQEADRNAVNTSTIG